MCLAVVLGRGRILVEVEAVAAVPLALAPVLWVAVAASVPVAAVVAPCSQAAREVLAVAVVMAS